MSWGVATQNGVSVSLASIVSISCGATEFSPASLFTSGVAGAWYDPSDYSTLFQDSAGTTPVTAVEQPVGLMLDKSQGLVLGSELVTNGDFASASGWTLPGTGTNSITGGQAVLSAASGYLLRTGTSITAGNWYRVSFTVSGYSGSGTVRPYIQASPVFGSNVTGNGTFVQYLLATATNASTEVGLNFATSFTGNIDDISIKSLAGNHASQATSASRPILRARYNLLTYSEQFNNAAWTLVGATQTANTQTAPDGTVTADTITGSSGANAVLFPTSGYTALAGNLTVSTYIKAGTADYAVLSLWAGAGTTGVNLWVNVQTGAVGSNSVTAGYTFVSGSSTAVGNGWYRVVLTGTVPAGAVYLSLRLVDGDNAFNYTNTVGKTLFVWGADLRTGSSAGTYQRIAAATDYATAGFLPYLAFDGVDDVLVATPASADYILNSVAFGAQYNAFTGNAVLGSIGNSTTGNPFSYINENSGTSVFGANARNDAATSVANYIGTTDLLPHVLISIWDTSGSSVRNNSSVVTGSAFTGVMTVNKFALGALGRNLNSAFSNSRIYSALFISPALTTAQSASLASYIAAKSGVTL